MRERIYTILLSDHLMDDRQVAFVSGPRQVGKKTTCRAVADARDESHHLNWTIGTTARSKWKGWKDLSKGLFDTYSDKLDIIVLVVRRATHTSSCG